MWLGHTPQYEAIHSYTRIWRNCGWDIHVQRRFVLRIDMLRALLLRIPDYILTVNEPHCISKNFQLRRTPHRWDSVCSTTHVHAKHTCERYRTALQSTLGCEELYCDTARVLWKRMLWRTHISKTGNAVQRIWEGCHEISGSNNHAMLHPFDFGPKARHHWLSLWFAETFVVICMLCCRNE